MEANEKAIIPLDAADGVDFGGALGCAVGFDGALGGNAGVLIVVDPTPAGGTTSTSGSAALFGGNAGVVKVKLAGTVSAGDYGVANGSTGKFTEAAATDVAQVRFIEDGVADERVSAILLAPAAAVGAEVYSAYSHNHDADYADIAHNHDGVYAPFSG